MVDESQGVGEGERELSEEEKEIIRVVRDLKKEARSIDTRQAVNMAMRIVKDTADRPLRGGFTKLTDEVLEDAFDLLDEGLSANEVRKELHLRPRDMVKVVNEYNRLKKLDSEKEKKGEGSEGEEEEEDPVKLYEKAFMMAQKVRIRQQAMRDAGLLQPEEKGGGIGGGIDQNMLLLLLTLQNQRQPQEKQLSPIEILNALADLQSKLKGKEVTIPDVLNQITQIFELRDKLLPRVEPSVSIPLQGPEQGKTLAQLIGEKVGDRIEKTIIEDVARRIEDIVTKKPEAIKEPTFQDQIRGILQALDESRVGQRITDDLIPSIAEYLQQRLNRAGSVGAARGGGVGAGGGVPPLQEAPADQLPPYQPVEAQPEPQPPISGEESQPSSETQENQS
jgi:hypothetical protein